MAPLSSIILHGERGEPALLFCEFGSLREAEDFLEARAVDVAYEEPALVRTPSGRVRRAGERHHVDAIRDGLAAGFTTRALAEKLGMSKSTVHYTAKRFGLYPGAGNGSAS